VPFVAPAVAGPATGEDLGENTVEEAGPRPRFLRPPDAEFPQPPGPEFEPPPTAPFFTPFGPPPGYTGRSRVVHMEGQTGPQFVAVEDRWRIGLPEWDRYDKGHPIGDDYPFMPGRIGDPFNQNVLKGDFPIAGQHLFFEVIASALSFQEYRQ